jgi:NADH-quinone oxidoreductase subunit H
VIPLFPMFVIFFVSGLAETNRAPFDLPEGESELVGGFHTEYSSLKFALFYLAEYINMVTVSALAATLFLGGWRAPWPLSVWEGANAGWWPLLWFAAKVVLGIFVFVWLRGTLPRLRYDQFMRFGWKVLVPVSLVWILVIGAFRVLREEYDWGTRELLLYLALPLAIVLAIASFLLPEQREEEDEAAPQPVEEPAYPVPPMDLTVPPSPRVVVPAGTDAAPPAPHARTLEGEPPHA